MLLVEKAQLTHGSTWHAAGLVGQLRGKRNLTRLMQNSVAVFDRLEAGDRTGDLLAEGRLAAACRQSPDRWSEIRRSMTQAKSFGVECHSLSAAEAKQRFPYIATDGIEGAAFIPGDGYVDPYSLTMAYAEGARGRQGVQHRGGRVRRRRSPSKAGASIGVVTDGGTIACDILVNCAGIWAKRVGAMAGVPLAAGVVEHQYFLTEKKLDFDPPISPRCAIPTRTSISSPIPAPSPSAAGRRVPRAAGAACRRSISPASCSRPIMERLELFALPGRASGCRSSTRSASRR